MITVGIRELVSYCSVCNCHHKVEIRRREVVIPRHKRVETSTYCPIQNKEFDISIEDIVEGFEQ